MTPTVLALLFAQFIAAPSGKLTGEIEQLLDDEKRIVRTLLNRGYAVRVKNAKVRAVLFQRFAVPHSDSRSDLELITAFPALEELSLPESACDDDLVYLRNMKELTHLDLTGCEKITGSGFVHLRHCNNLARVILQYSAMTDAAMKHLAGFSKLQDLDIYHTRVTDSGLIHLSGLKQLRKLRIGEMNVTGSGFRHIRNHPHLKMLQLSYSYIDDTGLKELNGLKDLRKLDLYDSEVTDSGFAHLPNHPNLEYLRFGGISITDRGIAHVARLTNLQELWIHGHTKVTDRCLKPLRSLTKLQTLYMCGDGFTDKCIPDLIAMKGLKRLELPFITTLTLQGLLKLEKALPRGVLQSSQLQSMREE